MNISLPAELKSYVEAEVATGLYANASDFMRDVLRERAEHREMLLAVLEDADASGDSDANVSDVVARGLERWA